MGNTFTKIHTHMLFATKHRKPLIKPSFELRLWAYLGGIANQNNMQVLSIGGIADHVHMLVTTSPTMPVSKAVQLLKGGSSKWLNDHFFEDRTFAWQKGYGAFSVSESMVTSVRRYIRNQKEHHRDISFREEYRAFLDKHHIAYDKNYVFG